MGMGMGIVWGIGWVVVAPGRPGGMRCWTGDFELLGCSWDEVLDGRFGRGRSVWV